MKKPRIIYLGTPEFAVAPLQKLVENGHDVVAVVTAIDKPAGRGLKLTQSAVKTYALAQNIPVLQPEKLKNADFLSLLDSYKADLQIVVAFRMLPIQVWNMPPLGTFNLHASLLPQYRGAAPINWAIINGEKTTGVSTFFLKHEIDTGDILFQETCAISPNETAGELYVKLMHLGASLVHKTVEAIAHNSINPKPQIFDQELKAAPKIFRDDCEIDWQQSAQAVHNKIRGLSPYPGAYTALSGQSLKIYNTQLEVQAHNEKPGTLIFEGKTLKIAVANGYIIVLELQLEGKKRMDAFTFINGHNQLKGVILG